MTQKINPVPKGYRTVTPGLVVRGVDQAVEFYQEVFEATTSARRYNDAGEPVGQLELKIGGSLVLLDEELPEWGVLSPLSLGATPVGQKLYLASPDLVYERAIEAGARPLLPLTRINISERSDEILGRFIDPFGHVWTVACRVPAQRHDPADEPAAGTGADALEAPAAETAAAWAPVATGTDGPTVEPAGDSRA
ncbi:MAG: hypothetical protein R3225_01330 [Halofilum sp. (in: g-proteobacteria)]|nr:hypothetical protein [Halofilum sp. (in: g-proteobacteria)]